MKITGPIIIVDDDLDDQELLIAMLNRIGINDRHIIFDNCKDAHHYLMTTHDSPFLILCDINLPGMNGLAFRKSINEDEFLRKKSIPFVFLSTTADTKQVEQAYLMTVQGFFIKQAEAVKMEQQLRCILQYWSASVHPNSRPYR